MRRFEEHTRSLLGCQGREPRLALPLLTRREPVEAEPLDGQSGECQRRRHRRRTGQARDGEVLGYAGGDKAISGIADRRHARVRDQQDGLAFGDVGDQRGQPGNLDLIVETDDLPGDGYLERGRQRLGASCVLRSNDVGGCESRPKTRRRVTDISHGCCGEYQATSHT